MTESPSLFSKIISGDIPCHKVYEDDKTLAFLDIHPTQPGHTLVIPKTEEVFVWDLVDSDYQALMDTAKKVALRIRQILNVPYVGEQIVGVDVPHAHIHLIPFNSAHQFHARPDMDADPDDTALKLMAKRLAF